MSAASNTESAARARFVAQGRALGAAGLNPGRAGNLSMRWHRGGADGMLISPSGAACSALEADAIVWVPLAQPAPPGGSGAPAEPSLLAPPPRWFGHAPPSSEWRMHLALYLARPAVHGVVHLHSPYATTLACTERVQREGIAAFHYMIALAGGEDIRCAPYLPFGSQALAEAALLAMHDRDVCLLANHGMLAVGSSLEAACDLSVELEALSRIFWQALALGEPVRLDAGQIAQALAQFAAYRGAPPAH